MPPKKPASSQVHQDQEDLGMDAQSIARDYQHNLFSRQAKFAEVATPWDHYQALCWTVRDRLLRRWVKSARTFLERGSRTVIYLSAEYLMGPQLEHNLINLGIRDAAAEAMGSLGLDLESLIEAEEEPGLGNGGLGRLAACYMDSLATLGIPAIGYGIRYEFGIFDQEIRDGWQIERTDRWLSLGNPWEIMHPEISFQVGLGGHVEQSLGEDGRFAVRWIPEREVRGIPCDTPVLGFGRDNTNFLRLWMAQAVDDFDLEAFNTGNYVGAVEDKVKSENITKILYPNDESLAGKRLRLEQQYFFVTCSLQDLIRIYLQRGLDLRDFHEKYSIQLNDTHPALAVVELMRLLVDVHGVDWDEAWAVTQKACAYTNHTLLPEALEAWPLPLLAKVLPRHLQLILEINRRFLAEVRARVPGDEALIRRLSLVDEEGDRRIRMAHIAVVGGHAVNGVAALHSRLLRETVLADFARLWPEKFTNVTNGVTPRRFLLLSNPSLSGLITEALDSPAWITDLERLRGLEPLADDAAFRQRWRAIKTANKRNLDTTLQRDHGLGLDPGALLDVQCKRIHEYKRQLMNILRVISAWQRLREGLDLDRPPRTVLFGGKAAPGYWMAKLIIRLAHGVAEVLRADPVARERLSLVWVPDFNVKQGQRIYPAADLSEQISTAGKEASGTGNMKFALNGALTIGTLDGANVEIRDHVGAENFFLFGLQAHEVAARKAAGWRPWEEIDANAELAAAIEAIEDGTFSRGDLQMFKPIVKDLRERDGFLVTADFAAYCAAQERVDEVWREPELWTRMSILNAARAGWFSSDRAVAEYAERIWRVGSVPISPPR